MTDSWHSMLNYIKYIIIHFLASFHIVVMGKLFLIVMLKLLFYNIFIFIEFIPYIQPELNITCTVKENSFTAYNSHNQVC